MKKILIIFALIICANLVMSNDKKNDEILIDTLEMESPLVFESWMMNKYIWNAHKEHKHSFRIHKRHHPRFK